jgi:hypothetical protein
MSSKHSQNRAKSRRRAQVNRRAAETLPAPFQCEDSGFHTARAVRDASLTESPPQYLAKLGPLSELRAKKYDVQAQYLRGELARHTRDDDP